MKGSRGPKLDVATRKWSEAVGQEIACHPGSRDEVIRFVLSQLRERLGLEATLSYGLSSDGDTLQVDFAQGQGLRRDAKELLSRYLHGREKRRWGYFDPTRPEPSQRNRVRSMHEDLALELEAAPGFDQANQEVGIHRMDQIRVLVCEGPAMLAWVGGFRQDTVTDEHRAAFASLVPALHKRLVLEQALGLTRLRSSALEVVLDALSGAAFVLRGDGRILLANAAGKALVDVDGDATRERLRGAMSRPGSDPGVELTWFPVPGEGTRLLAQVRPASGQDCVLRAQLLGVRWGLTRRQVEVLNQLAWGSSNKATAARLCCAEGTVEQHVAAIMRRAEVTSRAELVARFWTAPVGL